MNGILAVDKPHGWTSHDVVARVRRLCRQRSIGHAGTLDPMATGVLLLCLGEATRLSEMLMGGIKWYLARVYFGVATDTDDAQGTVVRTTLADFQVSRLVAALPEQTGALLQIPPAYAAIKHQGVPAYKRARAGRAVVMEPRAVFVHSITLLSFQRQGPADGPSGTTADLLVCCGKGTYIRALARDLGDALGCGAHLAGLRRLACGGFTTGECHTPTQLDTAVTAGGIEALQALLHPPDTALSTWPAMFLGDAAAARVRHGNAFVVPDGLPSDQLRLYSPEGDLLALASSMATESTTQVQPWRVFAAAQPQ